MLSAASADKKDKRKSSLKTAIGKIHFRKKRTSSALVLPEPHGAAHGNVSSHTGIEPLPRLEIPLYSKEALQRSLDDPALSEMHERHRMERNRHLTFQDAALGILRRRHQTAVSEQQSDNQRREDEKREKVRSVGMRFILISMLIYTRTELRSHIHN